MSRRINIAVDAFAFVVFLLAAQPERTGVLRHEQLGIAISATLVVHLLLHRAWVVSVVKRFLGTVARASRVNLLVDVLMGAAVAALAATGVALSSTLLAPLGMVAAHGGAVLQLHEGAAEIATVLLFAHLVLHRAWILRALGSVLAAVFRPVLAPLRWLRGAAPVPARAVARARERA